MAEVEPAVVRDGRVHADVAIIGAGVAGLYCAVSLPDHLTVVVIDKGIPGRSGSSPLAQGGLAAAIGTDDSPELHAEDTARAGDGLVDRAAALVLAREAPADVRRLIALGAVLDRDNGQLHLAREGGQSVARSAHRADATGAELVRALRSAAIPRVTRLEAIAHSLIMASGGVVGVQTVSSVHEPVTVSARSVLLATGGCGGLFAATTNPRSATGDGLALALRAGAECTDLEFVQFHPTCLAPQDMTGDSGSRQQPDPHWRMLLTEALRGAGATLHADDGTRFMVEAHPDAELAPRHVVSQRILELGGSAWLDATSIGAARLNDEFPTAVHGAKSAGFDLTAERVPVTPAAHYLVGGVHTDLYGRTSLPRLYAAGETACTGAHGANRLPGNSLAEALVFGRRSAATIAAELPEPEQLGEPTNDWATQTPDLIEIRESIRTSMWDGGGPVRHASGLAETATELEAIAEAIGRPSLEPAHVEMWHAVTAAQTLIRAAAARTESRGGHWRTDYPDHDPRWSNRHLTW